MSKVLVVHVKADWPIDRTYHAALTAANLGSHVRQNVGRPHSARSGERGLGAGRPGFNEFGNRLPAVDQIARAAVEVADGGLSDVDAELR